MHWRCFLLTEERYFYFSLGPVQEFVGKARRLRDYWTGSYLLSYLSEHAMDEVCKKGHIVFPPYEKGNTEVKNNDGESEIGSYPNRFQAKVSPEFEPTCCEKRVRKTWKEIADYVWERYIASIAPYGKNTKEIWDRQVRGFWYMQWVLADEENDALLDIRKNWRSYIPTVEPGDKCTLMGNLQEISGYIRSSGEKEKQDNFWAKLRNKVPYLDLKEGERLSAVALIKRLFPRVYNKVNKGSKQLPENFPSTTYMSAISWMKAIIEKDRSLAVDFVKEANKLQETRLCNPGIKCLNELVKKDKGIENFISLDGNYFYSHTLLNDNLWGGRDKSIRKNIDSKLKKINKEVGFKADTYYALLSMDGDHMGAILQENKNKKAKISEKISVFSNSVPGIIANQNGRVVYAGGEDVFAILPVDTAIDAAVELNQKYTELFEPIFNSKDIATISAAIIFAHHHAPLNRVYEEIQSLLNDKAKDECGRASLAICTWNTGGPDLVWAMPWEVFVKNDEENLISELSEAFGKNNVGKSISNSFLYNMRSNFELLDLTTKNKQNEKVLLNKDEVLELLIAEYIKSRSKDDVNQKATLTREKVKPLMKKLLKICTPYYRDDSGNIKHLDGFNMDGGLLIKFLARRWHR